MDVKDFCFKTSKQQASAAIVPTVAWVHGPDNNSIIINSMYQTKLVVDLTPIYQSVSFKCY